VRSKIYEKTIQIIRKYNYLTMARLVIFFHILDQCPSLKEILKKTQQWEGKKPNLFHMKSIRFQEPSSMRAYLKIIL